MFLAWGSVSSKTLEEWKYGKGHDFFGDRSSPEHPFSSPFFERHRRLEQPYRVAFDAWHSNLLDIPNGFVGIVAAVLALLAGISLASTWRAPWHAYAIPSAYGFLHTLAFLGLLIGNGGSPAIGSLLSLATFVVMGVAALRVRPAAARRGDPAPAILRSRLARRRKARTSAAHRKQ